MNFTTTLLANDPHAVRDALVLLLPRREALRLFQECGGSAARALELARVRGGRAWERFRAAQELHERALLEIVARGPSLCAPGQVAAFLTRTFATLPHEVFSVLFLDTRNRLIGMRELFRGTIDGASVYPREVVREAIAHNAAAVLFAHNHPSGVAEPSHADELITQRLKEALALVDIRVLDHFIVAGTSCRSFAERGLL